MVLTGDVGLGKTTISRRILSVLEEKGIETSLCFHTSYQDVELLREIDKSLDTMLKRAESIKKGHRSSFDFAIVRKLGEYDISEPDCEYILRNFGTKRVEDDDYVRNTIKKGLK